MFNLINNLIDKIDNNDSIENININEEIVENLYILIKNRYEELEEDSKWDDLVDKINSYVNEKYEYISKKSVFKFLDLLEEIE